MTGSVAVLGASSLIALDLAVRMLAAGEAPVLFARRPDAVRAGLALRGWTGEVDCRPLDRFGGDDHRAVVNFIGVGDPARAAEIGAAILHITREWDDAVLRYLDRHPAARYVFFSSGAVYGEVFEAPAEEATRARFPLNALGPQHWYALSKLTAEAVHRASAGRSIIDLRIFNYFSRFSDPAARFLVTDMVRAAAAGSVFDTLGTPLVRDFIDPDDLHRLLQCCLDAPAGHNGPVDAYSAGPVDRRELLAVMGEAIGLRCRIADSVGAVEATGAKPCYYSRNRAAERIGYRPQHRSADTLAREAGAMLATMGSVRG